MFTINIRGTEYTARTLAGISAAYCKARDESGEGATTFPFATLLCADKDIGYVSYNGRVWAGEYGGYSKPHNSPLYDPAADPVPAMLEILKECAECWPINGIPRGGDHLPYAVMAHKLQSAIAAAESSRT